MKSQSQQQKRRKARQTFTKIKPVVVHKQERNSTDCVRYAITNTIQSPYLVEDVPEPWPGQLGRCNCEAVAMCRINKLTVVCLTKKSKAWRRNPLKRILNSHAPLIVFGEKKLFRKNGKLDTRVKPVRHAIAVRNGYIMDPLKKNPLPLTLNNMRKIFNGKIVKVYLLQFNKVIGQA
jgi:hypothetical protein